ncbi:hypothetical protein C8Q79DRAFT_181126 [Trametes meyenii]|nr:hypothetical protein C8Q79DRAFT_181126 [Trametes meyenii]
MGCGTADHSAGIKQEAKYSLRSCSNNQLGVPPVNTLPVELLVEIFQWVQRPSPPWDMWQMLFFNLPRWHQVLPAVCSHWRNVAYGCPALWSNIEAGLERCGLPLLKAFLARSSPLPLDVRLDLPHDASPYLEALRPHIARFRSFIIDRVLPENGELLRSLFDAPMPLLENITIYCSQDDLNGLEEVENTSQDDMDIYDEVFQLPVDPRRFPRLTSLSMTTCGLKPGSIALPNVRRLNLEDCAWMALRMSDFLVFVAACDRLEELRLSRYRDMLGHAQPLTPIMLPATMRKLTIEDSPPFIQRILRSIKVVPTTNLDIKIVIDPRDPVEFRPLEEMLHDQLSIVFPEDKLHLDILRRVDTIRIDLSVRRYHECRLVGRAGDQTITITAAMRGEDVWQTPTPDITRDLVDLFRFAHLVELTITGFAERSFSKEGWMAALGCFPFLQRLAFVGHISYPAIDPRKDFLLALGTPQDNGSERCPVLQHLALNSQDPERDNVTAEQIRWMLNQRKYRGSILPRLFIGFKDSPSLVDEDRRAADEAELPARSKLFRDLLRPAVGSLNCRADEDFFRVWED